jgi:hypothetical protein
MGFIRKSIPIQDMARELGLSVAGRAARCWRLIAHRNGDAHPSIWFTRHNRGRCHVCDGRSWSNIDLVMSVLECDLKEALDWIATHYAVPQVPKGKHLERKSRYKPRYRVGTGGVMETIVRSGLLADLTGAEAKVLQALLTFTDPSTGVAEISYYGIMRYAGVGSCSTVRKALLRFQKFYLLQIKTRPSGTFRECGNYQFTPDDPGFLAIAHERSETTKELVQIQRQMRAQQKQQRGHIPRSNLSTPTVVRSNFTLHSGVASRECVRNTK